MKTAELIATLQNLGVKLWVDDNRLRCRAPKGVMTPDLKECLLAQESNVLAFIQERETRGQSAANSIQPVSRHGKDSGETDLPLSFAQQRLWFLEKMALTGHAYNVPLALQMKGQLNLTALQTSLNQLIARHESLRTRFGETNGTPFQRIEAPFELDLSIVDLTSIPPDKQFNHLNQLIQQSNEIVFNLEKDLPVRAQLLQLSDTEHLLLLVLHHIAADGWSLTVLAKDLSELYKAALLNQPSRLAPLPIQYVDFAVWQRQWLQGNALETQLSYWKTKLQALTPLQLPTDHPRPAVETFNGAGAVIELSVTLTHQLNQLAQQSGATLFMVLLTGFKVLLSRYTGQERIVVGSPIANRNRPEIEELIGFFVNSLVMHTDLSGNPSFNEALERVRQTALGAYAHQDLPFEKLVEELQPERSLNRHPLFQVVFSLQQQEAMVPDFRLPNLDVSWYRGDETDITSRFDIELHLWPDGDVLKGICTYNRDLFETSTIDRLLKHYQVMLASIVTAPDTSIGHIELLTPAEHQQLLVEWNQTAMDYPADQYIHQLIEQQAKTSPDAIAVAFNDQNLSYTELNAMANQLAYTLQQQGVNPGDLVGICVERSIKMVVGLLAILKAGGAYVPLDPSYPPHRLAHMLADSQVSILLSQTAIADSLPDHDAQVIDIDGVWLHDNQNHPQPTPDQHQSGDRPAYMIYTSGSTGIPKGVLISHRGLLNLVLWHLNTFNLTPSDRTTQMAAVAFDAAGWEIWPTLVAGACLQLVNPDLVLSPIHLQRWLIEQAITITFMPTPIAQELLLLQWPKDVALKTLLTGGDRLGVYPPADLPFTLVNNYGPTESSVVTTSGSVSPHLPNRKQGGQPSIGKAIANTQVYILDRHLNPVPIGIPGELHIGGDGLAIGYHNRPELTIERFISHPFRKEPEARLYKTGDLVRYRPDGTIEFLGRIDHQVKIRGFRIETGEIEATLTQSSAVKEAIVTVYEQESDKKLVAYLVAQPSSLVPAKTLMAEARQFIKERLPDYMIPAAFMVLDEVPLTANGKVDRNALPPLDFTNGATDSVAPRTPSEQAVADIWSSVLGLQSIGVDDNFFDIGGHSLLATQVISRLQQTFDIPISVRHLFERPTVRELAESVLVAQRSGLAMDEVYRSIPSVGRDEQIPLSFAQQRLWFLEKMGLTGNAYNIPLVLHLRGQLNHSALQASLNQLIVRHEPLRTRFGEHNDIPIQLIDAPFTVELPLVDLSTVSSEQQAVDLHAQLQQAIAYQFDLHTEPPIQVRLFQLSKTEHVLLILLHHIASDGWSLTVLAQDLSALYEDQPSHLSPLPVQYADFAVWQRQWLQGETLKQQLGYWTTKLQGLAPLQLPTDHPRPAVETFNGAGARIELSAALTTQLKQLAQQSSATLFIVLLAGFKVLLSRYTRQESIAVGSPIANRNRPEIEGLIGFFVNSLVMHTDLSGNPSFTEVLARVRQTALEAYAHQDVPFEKLVEKLQPERSLSHNPLFQVMFAVQQQEAMVPSFNLPNLEVSWYRANETDITTRFDIELHLWPDGDELKGICTYNRDLFELATIQRLLGHYQVLLEAIVSAPDTPVGQLALLTSAERQQLLVEWNQTATDYPAEQCIHQLFEAQTQKAPDEIAVVFDGQTLSYGELNTQSNQLAHYLQQQGVQSGDLVGICVDRSVEMVVGLLAILKAGGAYVPLDPTYPQHRLDYMIDDANLSVLLTQQQWQEQFSQHNVTLIFLDVDWGQITQCSCANPNPITTAYNLAYVIYTSGSTGRPKGVMVPHQAVVRLVCNTNYVQLQPTDRVAQVSNASFDAATFEIWGALLQGAQLVGISKSVVLSPHEFSQALKTHHINTLFLTTALFNQLVSLIPTALNRLKYLMFGGEAIDPRPVEQVLISGKPQHLLHVYGPTENTTFSTWYDINEVPAGAVTLPIGKPIANTQAYILDAHLNLVPIGIPGELHIGGAGLATGYYNRSGLTQEKFITHPFSNEPNARLYKTGDLVRYRPNGNIEFLGRIDHQVKIRGFRIETGEIEATLTQHTSVQDAVVVAREDSPGDKQLVAYVVAHTAPKEEDQPELADTQVNSWQGIFNQQVYTDLTEVNDPLFNIRGWLSNYDHQPIPEAQMRVWANDIVTQVLSAHPECVWEIGCGTGTLLFQIAPHTQHYYGTDISQISLEYVQTQIDQHREQYGHVQLDQRQADNMAGVADNRFDVVLLSSIVQYFPNIDYLLTVIGQSVRVVKPGGMIVLADIRSYPLMRAFHSSVQMYNASPSVLVQEMNQTIERQIHEETEFFVDPEFFVALKDHYPSITQVQVRLQRGHDVNELTKYRYTVLLHVEADKPTIAPKPVNGTGMDIDAIGQRLRREPSLSAVCFSHLTNGRVRDDVDIVGQLSDLAVSQLTVAQLSQRVIDQPEQKGAIDPEQLHHLAAELGYRVEICWSVNCSHGQFDAVFVPVDEESDAIVLAPLTNRHLPPRQWQRYSNNPLAKLRTQQLVPQLKTYLEERLPDYMVPVRWVVLPQLPLTPNGKVDHRALPVPDVNSLSQGTNYVAPVTPTQELLASTWSEILAVDPIGLADNFFDLGGHSLLATQIISRIRHNFGVEIPLKALFDHPILADLAQVVDVAQLGDCPPLPSIVPSHRATKTPLSFAQQRLWFVDRLEQNSANYNMFGAYRLEGQLNRTALEKSLEAIIHRHDSLRTTFKVDAQGTPYQDIAEAEAFSFTLPILDLSESNQEAQIKQLIQDASQQPFDISRDRLIRIQLLCVSPTAHVLWVTMHHIISDGWSIEVFQRELFQLYQAFSQNLPSPLPPLTIQYADFTYWQRQWMSDRVLDAQVQYWTQQLSEIVPLLELPTDYPRPKIPSLCGDLERLQLDLTLSQDLKTLSQTVGVTLFMTLLTAFQVLLSRYSGQTDIVVGSPIANRHHAEIESLIGFFVNTLVLRSDLSGNPSFQELLTQVRQTTLDAYAHQDLPFEKLVEELQPERRLDHHPVIQVIFALNNTLDSHVELPGLTVDALELEMKTSREFDLEFYVNDTPMGLSLACVYRTDLFKSDRIQRMLGHFQTLLQAIVIDSTQSIGRLPILTPTEQQQLDQWNHLPTLEQPLFLSLFQTQVDQHPEAIALQFQNHQLSYQALDARANQLAHYLQSLGVGPNGIVGVCMDRTSDLALLFLGILKAGGTYLPLDPTYPQDRLAYMLDDANVAVLVTQSHLLAHLPTHHAQVVTLEGNDAEIASQPTTPPIAPIAADTLAYIIYTSGSTGHPKGVMVLHRGLGNLAQVSTSTFTITATSRVLQFASSSFDASVLEMVMALASGACLCFGTADALLPGPNLLQFLQEQAISHTLLPPSVLAVLAVAPLPNLEVLLVGGEACPVPLMQQWAKGRRFFNAYGPTEATVYTTLSRCQPHDDTITIGRPVANTQVYVLDGQGQSVPIGVPGELHIGGIGLAQGYLNRPDLTAEKFIETLDPNQAIKRLYKTGDLVRYRSDGCLEFLGRMDHQVKLRGFRIELGEISTTLEHHPAVQAAIALMRNVQPGEQQLVAYAVTQGDDQGDVKGDFKDDVKGDVKDEDSQPSSSDLRQFLQEQLPNYMVPMAVIILPEFPLTPNGKLDRRALPLPQRTQASAQQLPKTDVEQQIAAIWQQLLSTESAESIGLDDNFFELGGHSLLMAQLQEQLQNTFNTPLPMVELFARPTVRTLAQLFSSPSPNPSANPIEPPPNALTTAEPEQRQRVAQRRKRQKQLRRRDFSGGNTQ